MWDGSRRLSDADLDRLIDEDVNFGDLTTRALAIGDKPARMTFSARQDLVPCGAEEASRLFGRLGAAVSFSARTGSRTGEGGLLLDVEGPAGALHAGWKVAQTLMEWASGIATLTDEIVSAARAGAPRIMVHCTRKAAPFTRRLSFAAVTAGGGEIHRLGLSDTIMVFPEHRVFRDRPDTLKRLIAELKERVPERSVMIEVTSEADALEAAEAMADVVQLEKFPPDAVRRVVQAVLKRADRRPIIAAAGGINARNARAYAETGADSLVTSAPYYAAPADIQVCITPR